MSDTADARLEADSLSALKSTFAFTRRARPPPPNATLSNAERTPLGQGANKLARRESRGGLRSMFTRNKADADQGNNTSYPKEEIIPRQISAERSPVPRGTDDIHIETPPHEARTKSPTSAPERRPGLRIAMRSKSPKTKPVPKTNTRQSPKVAIKPPRRTLAAWDPPPLFQAYPQAIKHAQLSSSTLSADSILRISNHRRNSSLREDITQSGLGADGTQTAAAKRSEKAKNKHRRQLSGSLSKAEWTEKIYVLVTSGYLLQYSGQGSFDRLPEKMMQLGKDSVAFASDVIPGKHWVLQISQAMDAEGVPAPDPRSLLSRLTFRGADYRRTATSLLLILDSAEELESWITAVRREIEALGGKKYVSETGKPKADEDVMQLKTRPSQRFLIQRDPDRFSSPPTPRSPTLNAPWSKSEDNDYLEPITPGIGNQHTIVPSARRMSIATSFASHESQSLDANKDNAFRLSYMSSGQRTLVTSQGSSPSCSPTRETFISIEESRPRDFLDEVRPRPNAAAISERRRSMQTVQNPAFEFHTTSKVPNTRPHSTYGVPGRGALMTSPSTPNFSVPHSVSKRYTLARIPDTAPVATSIQSKTPSRGHETPLKGSRKSPPTPVKAPQLSPVRDQPSPVRKPPIYTPTESSFQRILQRRPSMVDIPPRSSSGSSHKGSTSSSDPSHNGRHSSLAFSKSPGMARNSVDFTRQPPILKMPPIVLADAPKTPKRQAPMPSAAPHMIPLPPSPRLLPSEVEDQVADDLYTTSKPLSGHKIPASISRPRRPASMQVLTKSYSPNVSNTFPPTNGKVTAISFQVSDSSSRLNMLRSPASIRPIPTPPPSSFVSPSLMRLKAEGGNAAKKDLMNRRSMPHLVSGPPPVPPPNCALPPIPGPMRGPLAFKASRNSVRV